MVMIAECTPPVHHPYNSRTPSVHHPYTTRTSGEHSVRGLSWSGLIIARLKHWKSIFGNVEHLRRPQHCQATVFSHFCWPNRLAAPPSVILACCGVSSVIHVQYTANTLTCCGTLRRRVTCKCSDPRKQGKNRFWGVGTVESTYDHEFFEFWLFLGFVSPLY